MAVLADEIASLAAVSCSTLLLSPLLPSSTCGKHISTLFSHLISCNKEILTINCSSFARASEIFSFSIGNTALVSSIAWRYTHIRINNSKA